MVAFHAYCRRTLDNIRAQGRYREFTPLQKQAERFPYYRRPDGTEAAFVTLTRFESISDVKAFAGEAYEVPVLEPEALELLSRYDRRALHFETAPFVLP